MPTNTNSIMESYQATTEELRKILDSFTATREQKDAAEASVLGQLADTLDAAVTNLRERPFDHTLVYLQRLGDEVAMAQGEMTRGLRGGSAEIPEESARSGLTTPFGSEAAPAPRIDVAAEVAAEGAVHERPTISRSRDFGDFKDEYNRMFDTCNVKPEPRPGLAQPLEFFHALRKRILSYWPEAMLQSNPSRNPESWRIDKQNWMNSYFRGL